MKFEYARVITYIFICNNKVEAFLKKLDLRIKRNQENTYMFPSYCNMTEDKNEINVIQCVIKTHLSKLKNTILNYFPSSRDI